MPKKLGRPVMYQSDDERPVTISVRLPQTLYARLERYANIYRQSITELVRDGLEWRLEQDDPRRQVATLFDDDNTVLQETLQQMIDERVHAALEAQRTARQEPLAPVQEPLAPTGEPIEALDFDQTKYVLGKLCPSGHEYHGTGHSLRRRGKGDCYQCALERKREKRRAQSVGTRSAPDVD
jgi:hypothetical protein